MVPRTSTDSNRHSGGSAVASSDLHRLIDIHGLILADNNLPSNGYTEVAGLGRKMPSKVSGRSGHTQSPDWSQRGHRMKGQEAHALAHHSRWELGLSNTHQPVLRKVGCSHHGHLLRLCV